MLEKPQDAHQMQGKAHSAASELATNSVLRNTYALLALTVTFSAIVAGVSMSLNLPHPGFILTLVGFYGLLFLVHKTKDSAWGLASAFALTGFMGYTIGPLLNHYLSMSNGGQLIMTALGMTALVFFSLSAYVLTTRKDMSFLSGFLFIGFIVLVVAMLVGMFVEISGLGLFISAGFVLFSSAAILYQTSEIIHGGENNYILATISLYVSIYNLLLSLLNLLSAFTGDD